MENTHNFLIPKTNLIGVGAIKDLPNELLGWKLRKVLIVTDKNLIKLGFVENIEKILKSLFISYDIFDGIAHPDCTISFVEDAMSYFPKKINPFRRSYSAIITIGGGTNHDCGKAVATIATNGGNIEDYEGYNLITTLPLPVITINTTAGSAAEISMFSIITDNSRKLKMTIGSPKLTPYMSVNDPIFMTTLPKEVTASSGIDVLTHGIEAFTSTEASPLTDALALKAINLCTKFLQRSYENGNDLEARENMMYGNLSAGMAFNNAGLGYVHSIAHQLGGFYRQTHGCFNSVLLPYVFEFNAPSIPAERIFKIAEMMNLTANNLPQAVDKIIVAIKNLGSAVGIPDRLSEMGLKDEDIDVMSRNALKDICCMTNPRQGTFDDIKKILKTAM